MTEIITALVNAIEEGNLWVIIAFAGLLVLFRAKSIVTFWDERRRIKLSQLKEALACDCIKGDTRRFLEGELESEYYRLATGMKLEKEVREALINTHNKCNGELRFDHFRRARYCYQFEDGKLDVHISMLTKVSGQISAVIAMGLMLFGFVCCLFGIIVFMSEPYTAINSLALALASVGTAYYIGLHYLEYNSARLVKEEMGKQNS